MPEGRNYTVDDGIDAQNVLDETDKVIEKLIKKRRIWTGVTVFWFIIWLLILMYMLFFSRPKPEPVVVIPNEPKVESVQLYEYNLSSVGVSTQFDGGFTDEALSTYDEEYKIIWEITEGDNSFIAERTEDTEDFISDDENLNSLTGSANLGAIYGYYTDSDSAMICIDDVTVTKGIDGIAVVLPSETTDSQIETGVVTFLEKVNALGIKFNKLNSGSFWNMDDKSITDFMALLTESFNTECYVISSTGEDTISILGYGTDSVAVKSEVLKDGDKVVYITLERFYLMDDMRGHTTASYYSKYLQDSTSLEVFDDVNIFYETIGNEYN